MSGHRSRAKACVTPLLSLVMLLAIGCGSGINSGIQVSERVTVAITAGSSTIAAGTTTQLIAIENIASANTLADGSFNVTSNAVWSSSNSSVATVSKSGVVTGKSAGIVTITAALTKTVGTFKMTVGPPAVVGLSISPQNALVAQGGAQTYVATAQYANNTSGVLTSGVQWSVLPAGVATISANGLLTGVAPGAFDVLASVSPTGTSTAGSLNATVSGTVSAKTLTGITIAPINSSVASGSTRQFSATATYSDGSTANITTSVAWSTSNTGLLTIDANGLATAGSVNLATTVSVSAHMGTITAVIPVQVTPPASLTHLYVLPTSSSIAVGSAEPHRALAFFSDGSQKDVTKQVTWSAVQSSSVSDTVHAGIVHDGHSPGSALADASGISITVNQSGVDTAQSPGTGMVQATLGDVQSQSTVIVNPATVTKLWIRASASLFPVGSTQQIQLLGTLSDGTYQDLSLTANWKSSDASIATIDNTGMAMGIKAGPVQFTASFGGLTASTTGYEVLPATLISTVISANYPSEALGFSQQLHLWGNYSDGTVHELTSLAKWTSNDPTTIAINSDGVEYAIKPGKAQIIGTVFDTSSIIAITGFDVTIASIDVLPVNGSFALGTSLPFTAVAKYVQGFEIDATDAVIWTSSDPTVLTIDTTGRAVSGKVGTTTVSAMLAGVTQLSSTVTVTNATLSSLSITPNSSQVAANTGLQYAAQGIFSDGTFQDVSADVVWGVSDSSVASVSIDGLVTGIKPGQIEVTASLQDQNVSASLTVTNATLTSVALTPDNVEVPVNLFRQFSLIGSFSDGTTEDLTAAAIWSAATPDIASVILKGEVGGVTPGVGSVVASYGFFSASANVNVTNATLKSLAFTPESTTIRKGQQQQLILNGTFSDGFVQSLNNINAIFNSSNPNVASIKAAAIAFGVGVGNTTITGTFMGLTTSTTKFQVLSNVLSSIALSPAHPVIAAGGTQQFTATGTYADGSTGDLTGAVTWTSSDPAIVAVSASGLASALKTGTATVTSQYGSISQSFTVTINASTPPAPTLTGLAVSPSSGRIAVGTAEQLTATGIYSDGSRKDLSSVVAWSSPNTAVATVSDSGLVTGVAVGQVTIAAQTGTLQSASAVVVTAATLESVAVSPSGARFAVGSTKQFNLTGTFSDGSTQDLTLLAAWTSSAPQVATISAAGVAAGVAPGSVQFTASYGGKSATSGAATVSAATLQSVAITPLTASIAKGISKQFTVTGTYSDGTTQNLTGQSSFSSSNPSVVGITSSGIATGVSVGSAKITASVDGFTATSQTVTVSAATLVSILVSPASASFAKGTAQQFTATGTFSDGSTQDLSGQVAWSSSNAAVLTIGSTGIATGGSTGRAAVTAALDGITFTTSSVTITAATLTALTVTPATASIAKGTSQQLSAVGTYSDSSTQNLSSTVNWASSNGAVVSVSASGVATGTGAGVATLTATYQGKTAASTFTVTAATLVSIAFSPASPTIAAGTNDQVTVTGTFSDGSTQNLTPSATYSSSNPAAVTVSSTGVVTGVAPGTSTITVTDDGVTSSFTVTVSRATLASIAITPASPANIAKGTTQQFTATGTYSDASTQNLTNLVAWSSSNTAVATVSASGLATGIAVGTDTLTATYQGKTASSASFEVTQATVASLAITPADSSITAGGTQQFTATATYTDSTSNDVSTSTTWTSSNAAVLSIDANGMATAHATSSVVTVTITGHYGSVMSSVSASVAPASVTLTSIAVTPSSSHAAAGTTQQFNAVGTYSDGSTQDLTSSATWSSSNISEATVTSTGLATAVSSGTVTIQAASGTGASAPQGHATLVVTAATLASVAISPSGPSFPIGATQQFTLTGTFSDSSTQNLTNAATWTSSANGTATISSAGLATGVSPGAVQFTASYEYTDAATGNVRRASASAGLARGNSASPLSSRLFSASTSSITVTQATLVSIALTPTSASIAKGISQQFTVTGTYSDGSTQNLTGQSTFSSSDASIVSVASSGLASGVSVGSAQITATAGGFTATTQSVTVTAATLVSIAVSPDSASLADGTTQQFTATGTFSDGSTQDLSTQVAWSSSNPEVLTIDRSGLGTSGGTGSAAITASLNGITFTTGSVTVTAATLTALAVTPATASIAKGTSQQLSATGTYSDSSTQNLSSTVTWSSANGAVVSVSASGLATATGTGTSTLTATYQGRTATSSFTVSAATLVSIAFSPASPTIAAGTNAQVTVTGTFSDGSTQNLTPSATYSSSNPAAVTVSSTGVITGVAAGTGTITVTDDGVTSSFTVTVTSATLVSIAITPVSPASIANGTTEQFTATGTYSDASTQNLSTLVAWSSSNTAVATVNSSGVVTGSGVGTATLTATYQGISATSGSLQVTAAVVASLAITPANATLTNGGTQQFTATATYTDGSTQNLSGSATWNSSNPSVAAINSTGLATAQSVGATTISAQANGVSNTTTLTVSSAPAPTLASIAVSPVNASLTAGSTLQYTATGTYSDGSTGNVTSAVSWSSSAPGAATISATGLATGTAAGSSTITAQLSSLSRSTTLTVTAAPVTLQSIAITPSSASISKGSTQQYTATGNYSNGSTQNLTTEVTWQSSSTTVATINSSGLASGVAAGNTQIGASYQGQSATVTLAVGPAALVSLAVTPHTVTLANGTSQQYTAVGTMTDGGTQDLTSSVTWSSSNSNVSTINSTGLATTHAVGSANVTAASGTINSTAAMTVTAATVTSIQISPSSVSLPAGDTQQLLVTASFTDGSSQNVTTSVNYTTASSSVATVNASGLLTASATGTTTLTATLGSVSANASVTVSNATLASIAITPSDPSLAVGLSQQLTATGTFSDGSTQNLSSSVAWSSSTTSVATVSATGNVVVASTGTTTITASSGTVSATTQVTGTSAVVTAVAVSPASVTLAAGQTQQFTATATLSDSSQQDVTASAHWSVANPSFASVSNTSGSNGFLTSSAAGATSVTATVNSVSGSATVTVTAATLSSLAITPSPVSIPAGTNQPLTVTGTYTDGSTANLTASATFSSASSSIAAVNLSGAVHGVTAGSTTVTATVQGVSAHVTVTVTAAVLDSIAITPSNPSLALGLHSQLTATGTYSDGSTANITSQVQWSSSAPSIGTVSSTGLVSTLAIGSSTLTATLNSVSQTTTLTVTAVALESIAVTAAQSSFALGLSLQLAATGTYSDGSTQNLTSTVTWSSQTPSVGVVSSSGLATGHTTGTFNAQATTAGVTGSLTVTVTSAVLQSIVVTPANDVIVQVGGNVQFTATGHFSDGTTQNITDFVHWAVSGGVNLGSISQTGVFSPGSVGIGGTVTATSGSISGSTTFTIVAL